MWHESAEILSLQILNLSIKAIWWRTLEWHKLGTMVDWNGSLARISGKKLSEFNLNKNHPKYGHLLAQTIKYKTNRLILILFLFFLFQKYKILCWRNKSAEKHSFLTNSQIFKGQKF